MHYTQAEKMETIRLVESSELSVKQTLEELGIARSPFYRWYERYQQGGYDALADHHKAPRQFWNRIPDCVRQDVVDLALEKTELSPRQLAWAFTDQKGYFISESSVYRILKCFDLVTSPTFQIVTAKEKFDHPTKSVNEMWQRTLHSSRSWTGVGTICAPFWMTTRAISWLGDSPLPCQPMMCNKP